ncbi:MAG: phosphodiester glycosidase family protein [Clostridiales bacterium]|nr:phosphodiester glycosidase family protein [Clostridiales bacterium]
MNVKRYALRLAALLLILMSLTGVTMAQQNWAAPCVPAPYDHAYQSDTLSVAIKRYERDGIVYWVADVQVKDAKQLKAGLSSDKPNGREEQMEAIASRNGAVIAINGDYYGAHKYGTIIRNGQLIRSTRTTRNMLIVDQFGDMSVRVDRDQDKVPQLGNDLAAQGVWQTFEFGPELVRDGQAVTFSPKFDVISTRDTRREPRTALGQIGPLHYIIVVADGRQDGYSKGMTLPELQQVFIEHGAVTAMNLDGGGSTELWFQGNVISHPFGGGKRTISDIVFF